MRYCQGERGNGPWSGERKRQLAEKHIKDGHSKREVQFTTLYVCIGCKKKFHSFIPAGRHARPCPKYLSSSIVHQFIERTVSSEIVGSKKSPNHAYSPFSTFPPCRIEGDKIILKYPGGPTKCPRCEWTTPAKMPEPWVASIDT